MIVDWIQKHSLRIWLMCFFLIFKNFTLIRYLFARNQDRAVQGPVICGFHLMWISDYSINQFLLEDETNSTSHSLDHKKIS